MTSTNSPSLISRFFWWLPIGRVAETGPEDLVKEMQIPNMSTQLLDVRTRNEWSKGHIKGTINIPITELRSKKNELPFIKDKPVVAICLSAHRSIPAVRLLRSQGFRNVSQLSGGMRAWRQHGLKESKK
tara:strand:- start:7167 stop:7553 length:387 start_codon:yes stop_codon:yes gene_type:complete